MFLIRNSKEWGNLQKSFPRKFNTPEDTRVLGSPKDFPCFISPRPGTDVNGLGIFCTFFYLEDAYKLIEETLVNQ